MSDEELIQALEFFISVPSVDVIKLTSTNGEFEARRSQVINQLENKLKELREKEKRLDKYDLIIRNVREGRL